MAQKLRTIKPDIAPVYSFECPSCGYHIDNPDTGSTMWLAEELAQHIRDNGRVLTCNYCDNSFRITRTIKLGG